MKTGLTKKQKTTTIYFDEDNPMIEVCTYNRFSPFYGGRERSSADFRDKEVP